MTRKAEVISSALRARPARLARTSLVRARRAPFVAQAIRQSSAQGPEARNDSEQAWQLIHDDPFDHTTTDAQIEAVVTAIAARSLTPYAEVLRRLVGIEGMAEPEARTFFQRVLDHRRGLSVTLGRAVHVRVAALDVLTMLPSSARTRHDSRPILVTPSLLERAFEEAAADGVTGLPQRAQFMSLLRHELRQRKRRHVSVAYVDLDRFKAVNDAHGHARGDEVLRLLARSARGALREGDVLARMGGDEFAILLVDVTPTEADAALRRFRARFEALTAPLGTSFSAGIAVAGVGEDAERLITRADEAMYRQKRARAAHPSG